MQSIRRLAGLAFTVLAVCGAAAVTCNVWIVAGSSPYRFTRAPEVPRRLVAIVLGAGLNPDGTPSAMLADRLDGAIALYRAHRVRGLLLTGDNGTVFYNELGAMLPYARAHGVPGTAIAVDYAGFNTYDSCYRAVRIFGVRAAVVVTQAFHLPRAIFIGRAFGIDAVGYAQPDWGRYNRSRVLRETGREASARVKAVWQVLISHPVPPVMGKAEQSFIRR